MNARLDYIVKPMTYNELCKVPNIKRLKKRVIRGIYFLIAKKTVVYVGQSSNIIMRTNGHKHKIFDRVLYIESDINSLNDLETHYIIAFNPKYNKSKEYETHISDQIPEAVLEKRRIKEQKRENKERMKRYKKNLAKMYKERIHQIESQPYQR